MLHKVDQQNGSSPLRLCVVLGTVFCCCKKHVLAKGRTPTLILMDCWRDFGIPPPTSEAIRMVDFGSHAFFLCVYDDGVDVRRKLLGYTGSGMQQTCVDIAMICHFC